MLHRLRYYVCASLESEIQYPISRGSSIICATAMYVINHNHHLALMQSAQNARHIIHYHVTGSASRVPLR